MVIIKNKKSVYPKRILYPPPLPTPQTNLDSGKARADHQDVLGTHKGHFRFQTSQNRTKTLIRKTFDQQDFEDKLDQLNFKASASVGGGGNGGSSESLRSGRRGGGVGFGKSGKGPMKLRGADQKTFENGALREAKGSVDIFFGGVEGEEEGHELFLRKSEERRGGVSDNHDEDEDEDELDVLRKHLKAKMDYQLTKIATRRKRRRRSDAAKMRLEEFDFVSGTLTSKTSETTSGTLNRLKKLQKQYDGKIGGILSRFLNFHIGGGESKEIQEIFEGVWLEAQSLDNAAVKIAAELVEFVRGPTIDQCKNQTKWNNCLTIFKLLNQIEENNARSIPEFGRPKQSFKQKIISYKLYVFSTSKNIVHFFMRPIDLLFTKFAA